MLRCPVTRAESSLRLLTWCREERSGAARAVQLAEFPVDFKHDVAVLGVIVMAHSTNSLAGVSGIHATLFFGTVHPTPVEIF